MNSCTLMAEIVESPQPRRTQDDRPVTNMFVKFEGSRDNDPPGMLRVTGWGNLAEELSANYQAGDRVILIGSLKMDRVEVEKQGVRYKENRVELILSRIYKQEGGFGETRGSSDRTPIAATPIVEPEPATPVPTSNLDNVVPIGNYNRSSGSNDLEPEPTSTESTYEDEADLDDIPF
ncbi:MAG: single-stranded DNA-binding protein [Cyanobacteria bacterium SBLK]|nr:single-stranded DNA-binding protein [Cyanobacteria bacterium SBLK]